MENERVVPEQTNQIEATKQPENQKKPKKTVSMAVFIVTLLLVLLLGGLAGYGIGSTMKENELTDHYESEIDKINNNVDDAKESVADSASQDQQTIDELRQENAEQEALIDQQNQKIADLERQLEEAESTDMDNSNVAP